MLQKLKTVHSDLEHLISPGEFKLFQFFDRLQCFVLLWLDRLSRLLLRTLLLLGTLALLWLIILLLLQFFSVSVFLFCKLQRGWIYFESLRILYIDRYRPLQKGLLAFQIILLSAISLLRAV